jgi:hypothetical protein
VVKYPYFSEEPAFSFGVTAELAQVDAEMLLRKKRISCVGLFWVWHVTATVGRKME